MADRRSSPDTFYAQTSGIHRNRFRDLQYFELRDEGAGLRQFLPALGECPDQEFGELGGGDSDSLVSFGEFAAMIDRRRDPSCRIDAVASVVLH